MRDESCSTAVTVPAGYQVVERCAVLHKMSEEREEVVVVVKWGRSLAVVAARGCEASRKSHSTLHSLTLFAKCCRS